MAEEHRHTVGWDLQSSRIAPHPAEVNQTLGGGCRHGGGRGLMRSWRTVGLLGQGLGWGVRPGVGVRLG
jgi:hypothetical protein